MPIDSFEPDQKDSFEEDSFVADEAAKPSLLSRAATALINPGPEILKAAGTLGKAAITPIPALNDASSFLQDKAAESMDASRPDVLKNPDTQGGNIMETAFKEAAVAARNSTIAIPTPDFARAQIALTVPTTPIDIVSGLAGGIGAVKALKTMKQGVEIPGIGSGAGLPAEGKLFTESQQSTLKAMETQTNFNSAIDKVSAAKEAAFKEINTARSAIDAHKATFPGGIEPVFERKIGKINSLERNLRVAQAKVDKLGKDLDGLRVARDSAPPSVDATVTAPPSASTPFPLPKPVAQATASVTPETVSYASKYINLERLKDESAREIIAGLSQDPAFGNAIGLQKRGVIPLEQSQRAGRKLGLGAEDFAALKPGQMPKKGTLDAQMAAASAMQNTAAKDLGEVAQLWKNGTPIEKLSDRIAMNYEAIVGAQGVISEGGRGLGAVRMSNADRAMLKIAKRNFAEGLLETPEKLQAFLKEVSDLPTDAIAQRILAAKKLTAGDNSWLSMFQEARGAALLTNPVTFIRNLTGNSMAVMSNLVERPLAGTVDFMRASVTGTPQERLIGEAAANSYGMWSGIKTGARDAVDVILNERSMKGFGSEFATQGGAIPGALGKAVRLPFRSLDGTDTFFKTILGHGELNRLAYRQAAEEGLTGVARAKRIEQIMAAPTDEMLDAAINISREFTYQDKLGGAMGKVQQVINQKDSVGAVSKFIIPFFRTPVNVAKFAIERTPILSELTKRGVFRTAFLNSGASKGEVADAIARNLVGTAALGSAAVALHANEGRITGAPPKDKVERENLYGTGWRPYSIKIGDSYVSYRGFEPMASWLAGVSDMAKDIRTNPDADYSARGKKLVEGVTKNFLDQPFLTNLRDVLDALDNPMGGKVKSLANSQLSSLVPQGVAAITRSKDRVIRDPETVVESMMAKMPYLSERVRPKLSRFGEPIQRTTYWFGLTDKPLETASPVEKELLSLSVPKAVGMPDNHMSGRALSKDEYNELLTRAGGGIKGWVEAVLAQPQYRNTPMEQRTSIIKSVVEQFRADAASIVRPKVEMRYLGINEKLEDAELKALNGRIEMPDFRYLKDNERRSVVNDFIRQVKESRK